jgi:hypothetical protein
VCYLRFVKKIKTPEKPPYNAIFWGFILAEMERFELYTDNLQKFMVFKKWLGYAIFQRCKNTVVRQKNND